MRCGSGEDGDALVELHVGRGGGRVASRHGRMEGVMDEGKRGSTCIVWALEARRMGLLLVYVWVFGSVGYLW